MRTSFDDAVRRVIQGLESEGFDVLTDIDDKTTLKKKLNVDSGKNRILGTSNLSFAHQALLAENKVGTMLPCSLIVGEVEKDEIEVAAIDPTASMRAIENAQLADQVRSKLFNVIDRL